jgi:uncharacterized membrane protein
MAKELFTTTQQEQIVEAIRLAEDNTSGEIKVHVEERCSQPDVLERAKEVFVMLNLDKTQNRNGVLFYLSVDDRKYAILGDYGIDSRLPDVFWQNIKDTMRSYFQRGELVEGLSEGIRMTGEQLKQLFPYQQNDINELPDDISFGS